MRTLIKGIVALALVLGGCQEPDPSELIEETDVAVRHQHHQQPPQPLVGHVTWHADDGTQVTSANVNTTVDLLVHVTFDGLTPPKKNQPARTVSVYLRMPNGDLWTSALDQPIDPVAGMWFGVPVAGTDIQGRQLVGTWTTQAILSDGISTAQGSILLYAE